LVWLYVLQQIATVLALAAFAYLVAKAIFRAPLGISPLEEVAVLTPVGIAVFILAIFGLGMLGSLNLASLLTCLGAMLAFAAWRLLPLARQRPWRRATLRLSVWQLVLGLGVLALLTPLLLTPITPPHHSDEIRFHLPYALHFVEQGGIVPDLYLRYPFHTLNMNLLYAAGLLVGDDVTPHYMHFLMGCLTALSLYALAKRLSNRFVAGGAVLLFLFNPTFIHLSATAYIDLGVGCFLFSTIACLSYCRDGGSRALVACAALLFGTALGTKYLALAFTPLLLAWAYYVTRDTRSTALFGLGGITVGMPWYLYNTAHTGNPISPFAGHLFGHWPWTADDMTGQMGNLSGFGMGTSPEALLMLPYNLLANPASFQIYDVPVAMLIVFASLPLIFWWDKRIIPYGILLLAVLLGWFWSSQVFRYLTAILPVWCFLSIWSLDKAIRHALGWALSDRSPFGFNSRRVIAVTSFCAVLSALVPPYLNARGLVRPSELERFVVQREQYLKRTIREYGVIQHIRQSGYEGQRIYQISAGALLSYLRNNRVLGDWYGILGYKRLINSHRSDPEGLLDELEDNGISLLVVSRRFLQRHQGWRDHLTSHLHIDYEDEHVLLFHMPTETVRNEALH